MTINLFVTAVVLTCFLVMIPSSRHPRRPPPLAALALMLVVESPLLLHPDYVPLSHVLFEVSTQAVLVGSIVVVASLWVTAAARLRRFATPSTDPTQVVAAAVLLACAAFWIVLAATISDVESGPTPTVWDKPVWVAHLATLYIAAGCQITLIVRRKRSDRVAD